MPEIPSYELNSSTCQSMPAESASLPATQTVCVADSPSKRSHNETVQLDAAEVRRAQAGDTQALCGLIENNRTWVRGTAYAVLGDAHLAEDVAQDVFVRMVKHLHKLKTPEAFRPWLHRMTRNVALTISQRCKRAPQTMGVDMEQMATLLQVSKSEPPEATLEADERYNVVLEAIHRLPRIYREVLVLKHVRDLTYAELSTILGVNIKSLEVRLVRARKLLQIRLGCCYKRRRKHDPGGKALNMKDELLYVSQIPA